MNLEDFLKMLASSPESVQFSDTMAVIDKYYDFEECVFLNGDLVNQAGENSGSCKLFYFAKLQGLSKEQTLACFGAYYWDDVLVNPQGDSHQNIRNFIKTGWDGIQFLGTPLHLK